MGRHEIARPVVTGLGVVSPIGSTWRTFWAALLDGRCGTGNVARFDTTACVSHRAGEVGDDDFAAYGDPSVPPNTPRATKLAVAAARMAVDDAHLDDAIQADRVGVCFGTVLGHRPAMEPELRRSTGFVSVADAETLATATARSCGFRGPALVVPTACAAGNSAIAIAADLIAAGRADVMIAGGSDELSHAMFLMFNRFRALSTDVVRPFDLHRNGLILSEGAAALVIESAEHAARRGATPLARVLGHGDDSDAFHMTAPHPNGTGAARAMKAALDDGGVSPEAVDYICAHGTATPANDAVECKAIRDVFGSAADDIPVSSIKSMLGHTQGAAAAIEAVACVLAIRDHVVPPTINYETPDPKCNVNVVASAPVCRRVDVALNNAFGFGGNICCVLFGRPGLAAR